MAHLKGLFKAIRYYGSQNALAKAIGRSRQNVTNWINREEKIADLQAALKIFTQLKGLIPLHELTENAPEIRKLIHAVILFDNCPTVELSLKDIQITHTCPVYQDSPFFDSSHHELSLPILIDHNNQLITCECRLRNNILSRQKKIRVHRIDLTKLITQKISITALLEILPISERAAIGMAIEHELGNRQGKRIDLQLPDNYPEVNLKLETREIAASNAGFNSEFLYRQVKYVIKKGIPQLIQAMDSHLCTISKAKQIAMLPKNEQDQNTTYLFNKKKSPNH